MNLLKELIDLIAPEEFVFVEDTVSETNVIMRLQYKFLELHQIYDCLNNFPKRDSVSVKYKFSEDDEILIKNEENHFEIHGSLIEIRNYDLFIGHSIDVKVVIIKRIDDSFSSVYNMQKFEEWLFTKNKIDIMKIISQAFLYSTEKLVFICYDFNGFLITDTIGFISPDVKGEFQIISERNDVTDKFTKICNFHNSSEYQLIPNDFKIISSLNIKKEIIEIFESIKVLLALIYISDISDITFYDINLTLKGYGTRSYKISSNEYSYISTQKVLYDIYQWIYTDGNVHDKIQIARNIITLHCKFSNILDLDEKTLISIRTSYDLYLKENVNNYLNLKKDFSKFIQAYVNDISKTIGDYFSDLKKNFLAYFTSFAALIISNSIRSTNIEDIFNSQVVFIITLALFGSLLFGGISLFEAISRYKKSNIYIENIKTSYTDVLSPEEINSIIDNDKTLEFCKKDFIRSTIMISIVWFLMFIGLFVALDYISGDQLLLCKINFL